MHLRRWWAWLCSGLVSAVLLSACVPSAGPRGPERDEPRPPALAAANPEEPPSGVWSAPAEQAARPAAPRREGAIVQRGTGVFVNPDAVAHGKEGTGGQGEITLNFAGADVREVVRTVLGDTLGLNYAVDPAVQGSITMQTSQPLPRSAVLPALESVLQLNGATIVEADGLYRVVPLDGAAVSTAAPLIGLSIDTPVSGSGVRIVPLRHVSPPRCAGFWSRSCRAAPYSRSMPSATSSSSQRQGSSWRRFSA
jgi:general secretion pathway protein D